GDEPAAGPVARGREGRCGERAGVCGELGAAPDQGRLEVVRRAGGTVGQLGELGLDPTLVLDEVAAGVAGVDVVPAALLLLGSEAAVDQGADAGSEVRHHDTTPR